MLRMKNVTKNVIAFSMKPFNLFAIVLVFFLSTLISTESVLIYESPGFAKIGYIIHQCTFDHQNVVKSLIHSSIWTQRRINQLQLKNEKFSSDPFGLEIHKVCTKDEYLKTVFELYDQSNNKSENNFGLLGIIIDQERFDAPLELRVVHEFSSLLGVKVLIVKSLVHTQILAGVKILEALNLTDLYVVVPNQEILKEFYRLTRRDWICVKTFEVFNIHTKNVLEFYNSSMPTAIFGRGIEISSVLESMKNDQPQISLLIPLDGNEIIGPPENSLILEPLYTDVQEDFNEEKIKFLPSPLFIDLANYIIKFTKTLTNTCLNSSTEDNTLTKCYKTQELNDEDLSQQEILSTLKIEPLSHEIVYNIITMDNDTRKTTVFTYSVLDGSLNATNVEYFLSKTSWANDSANAVNCFKEFEKCILECENFKSFEITTFLTKPSSGLPIGLRQEPWVFAFISMSTFGIFLCLAILCYIISRLCKKQILEGNPILTILLLIDVIIIYASIIPFVLDCDKAIRAHLHLIRALMATTPYTFAFALLLSRTILLATVSKEIGFMSHVAGSVQGFLTLFIFAVQAAFSLQLFNEKEYLWEKSHSIIYLMSYNVMLLVLLTFVCPLIVKSQRNYREGKYFTISIALLAISWSCWLPSYAVLGDTWKDPILCFGFVSTGSILLGGIFIPRTYLMTVSAARDRFTSALPSLATATSAMDIYRASTQPVYDCVNVAAVTAANLRAEHLRQQQQLQRNHRQNVCNRISQSDYYATTEIPDDVPPDGEVDEENEFEVTNCDSPPIDKVTRF